MAEQLNQAITDVSAAEGDSGRVIVVWVLVLFGLTAIGIAPLYMMGLNVQHLTPRNVSVPVGLGIELTAYAPSLAALLVAGFGRGGGGVRPLLRQLNRWRVHVAWYAIALLGPFALFLAADAVRIASGNPLPSPWLAVPSGFAVGSIVAGSLGEEIGWRGFGQARLQRRYGALRSSLVVGLIWTVWHYWGVFAPGGLSDFALGGFALSLLRMGALSILYAWLYNSSHQSLLIPMAAHAGHNIADNAVPATAGGIGLGEIVTLFYAVAAIVVVAITTKHLGWPTRFSSD